MMEENPSPKKSTEIDLLLAEIPVSQRPTDPVVIQQLLNSITVMVPAPSPTVTVGSEFFETSKTAAEDPNESDLPIGSKIGRYSITSRLGFGGFGSVYLAHDTELGRLVAIKIPHLKRVRNDVDRLMYLMEARTLAQLDHQGIVPVYDFGVMSDGRCFVVSKYIAGQDLSHVLQRESLVISRSVEILIAVADALHYVHETRMVHRDIKPGNLLVGDDGRIYVADFGLALRESRQPSELSTAGTPSYMSPEQVRGEGHRVDGRSDQFSLGCVMYEILTGVRAFTGHSTQEILHRVVSREPDPPREINRKIPRELNRICLKLLSKLAMDRYAATSELADDLRHWLETNATVDSPDSAPVRTAAKQSTLEFTQTLSQSVVVPRGLHAFTMDDAGFFMTLLPGIRDRNGLPPSLSHWKRWIDSSEMVPEMHRVGVISGPTGCGKSSLVRAGLFPLLSDDIVTVLVDASPDATERQLVQEIERQCHERIADSLTDWIAAIRRGRGLPKNKTLLIVIDQFEQWLHAHPSPLDTELVRSMRQCDGSRVQCLILVRDDFWLALSRFMDAVESPLILRNNALMVDLFREDHARKVLIEFGRGFGRLPKEGASLSDDQNRFVDEVLSNLSANGNIVPVHLALFTEMVKNRDWVPATLRQIGGAIGVGSTFLSESFSGSNAPENHRLHENAARKVLRALLPSAGTDH